jgi:hypothetical protein
MEAKLLMPKSSSFSELTSLLRMSTQDQKTPICVESQRSSYLKWAVFFKSIRLKNQFCLEKK